MDLMKHDLYHHPPQSLWADGPSPAWECLNRDLVAAPTVSRSSKGVWAESET